MSHPPYPPDSPGPASPNGRPSWGYEDRPRRYSQGDPYSGPRAVSSDHARARRSEDRGRSGRRRASSVSSDSIDSISPSRSRSRSRRRRHRRRSEARLREKEAEAKAEKHWYHKKSLWTGLATIAAVASLVPSALSVKQTQKSAKATEKSARAVTKSAHATMHSADATRQSAGATMLGAKAAINSGVAQGHMDFDGRYTGPATHGGARRANQNGGVPPHEPRAVALGRRY